LIECLLKFLISLSFCKGVRLSFNPSIPNKEFIFYFLLIFFCWSSYLCLYPQRFYSIYKNLLILTYLLNSFEAHLSPCCPNNYTIPDFIHYNFRCKMNCYLLILCYLWNFSFVYIKTQSHFIIRISLSINF